MAPAGFWGRKLQAEQLEESVSWLMHTFARSVFFPDPMGYIHSWTHVSMWPILCLSILAFSTCLCPRTCVHCALCDRLIDLGRESCALFQHMDYQHLQMPRNVCTLCTLWTHDGCGCVTCPLTTCTCPITYVYCILYNHIVDISAPLCSVSSYWLPAHVHAP